MQMFLQKFLTAVTDGTAFGAAMRTAVVPDKVLVFPVYMHALIQMQSL